jgi:hypothetical protein
MSKVTNQQRIHVFKVWLAEFHSKLKRKGKLNTKRKFEEED